jgi:serine phosphatase RsbU (regulator of sigma subunit)
VLLVGDVVGKGVHAARRAVFVRTSLVTFAPFEDDPARLLRLANAALIDRAGTSVDYVTAVCVVHRPADETLAWAIAGHPPPLRLDDGEPLDDWGAGQPLGLEAELAVASRVEPFGTNSGVLLYTDGILDARDDAAERFGEERLQALVASHGRESAPALVEHLRVALAAYAPAGGDDVCLLAARNRTRVSSEADR